MTAFTDTFHPKRIRPLNEREIGKGPVIYWMSREQRVDHNWALLYAREMAKRREVGLLVVFNLVPAFKAAAIRQYDFMLKGLQEVEERLANKEIPLVVAAGDPAENMPRCVKEYGAGLLVTDFSPLRLVRQWKGEVAAGLPVRFEAVDAHNIIPVWVTSDKQEYAARTIRPKIHRKLVDWLVPLPDLYEPTHPLRLNHRNAWAELRASLEVNEAIKPVGWLAPGQEAGKRAITAFINDRLPAYDQKRNDPAVNALSQLSPYLHFGHISAQHLARRVEAADVDPEAKAAFLEEMIVRRELADNYCHYNSHYDRFEGFPGWAQKTLAEHAGDERPHTYSLAELERAETHDDLWNAAQVEMNRWGKMHGYVRMYWCKKILEWSKTPQQAQQTAIRLNDAYFLDGRDPIGYTNIAWSIGGVHDRGWTERPIFGKIRYMSRKSTGSKFDVEGYKQRVNADSVEAYLADG